MLWRDKGRKNYSKRRLGTFIVGFRSEIEVKASLIDLIFSSSWRLIPNPFPSYYPSSDISNFVYNSVYSVDQTFVSSFLNNIIINRYSIIKNIGSRNIFFSVMKVALVYIHPYMYLLYFCVEPSDQILGASYKKLWWYILFNFVINIGFF